MWILLLLAAAYGGGRWLRSTLASLPRRNEDMVFF